MSQLVSYEEYLNTLAEKSIDNTRQLKQKINQRRNGMEDLYGICFSSNGDASTPASFFISISPDYVYLQRFAFKFVIKPFTSSVAGAGGTGLTIGETYLDGEGGEPYIIPGTSTLDISGGGISPNPHTHSASGEITGLTYGVKKINTASLNWRVRINGVDITAYLAEQYDGAWIQGEGIYPNNQMTDFYDILDVASVLTALGRTQDRERLLSPEFKRVEIMSDAPFGVDAYLYLKYANTNR